jgi:hypothetical protein
MKINDTIGRNTKVGENRNRRSKKTFKMLVFIVENDSA